jgi:hypothetical protein
MPVVTGIITLADAKADMHVTHDLDDSIIQAYVDAAHDEALQFLDKTSFDQVAPPPSSSQCCGGPYPWNDWENQFYDPWSSSSSSSSSSSEASSEWVPPASLKTALLFLVRAKYDASDADDIAKYRSAAETLLMPFRIGLGV